LPRFFVFRFWPGCGSNLLRTNTVFVLADILFLQVALAASFTNYALKPWQRQRPGLSVVSTDNPLSPITMALIKLAEILPSFGFFFLASENPARVTELPNSQDEFASDIRCNPCCRYSPTSGAINNDVNDFLLGGYFPGGRSSAEPRSRYTH